ncbi:MAG: amino acid permease [Oscillospiraceae bacterium]|nr:amino acid permease [Oscillospiraceae bacterium]
MDQKKQQLNLKALVAISSGGAVSSVITTVMLATAQTGRSAWIAYSVSILIGGILRILPVIWFASMFRYKGGNYALVTSTLGEQMGGIYALWWLPMFLSRGMGASAMGEYLKSVFPSVNANLAGIIFTTIAFVINLFGISAMVKVQKKLTLAAGAALLVYVIFGFTKLDAGAFSIGSPSYFLGGGAGLLMATVLVIQGASGPSLVSGFSWESENPRTNIPRAIFLSNLIMLIVCGLVSFTAANIAGGEELYGKALTFSAGKVLPGILFPLFMLIGPFMTLFISMNSGMPSMAAPVVAAIGNGWLPEKIGKTNRYGVPWIIYTVMWLICIIPLMLGVSLRSFTAYTVIAQRTSGMLLLISAFRYPKVYREEWKASRFHMSNYLYYPLLVLIACVELFTLYMSVRSIGISAFIGNLIVVALLALYAIMRYKGKKTNVRILVER